MQMIIISYLSRLVKTWTTWAFTALELLTFIIGASRPDLNIPPAVYYVIAGLGFLVANVQLFSEAERQKQALRSEVDRLKASQANLLVSVSDVVFLHDAPVLTLKGRFADGLDNQGLPIQAIMGAKIQVQNTGTEEGELEWHIIDQASELPDIFHLRQHDIQGQLHDLPDRFDGRRRWEGQWRLECGINESDPQAFAEKLSQSTSFLLVMRYRTLRAGDPTQWDIVTIEGSLEHYRQTLVKRWQAKSMDWLASIVSDRPAG